MAETPLLKLPLLAAAQAQKHVTHNEALKMLDALVQISVISMAETDPPAEPDEGDRYIPASGATGAWADGDFNIFLFTDGAWLKIVPLEGWKVYDLDTARFHVFDGAEWIDFVSFAEAPTVQAFTASGTWIRPAGCKKVRVTVRGGGGGGGGTGATGSGECSVGAGGAEGGLSIKWIDVTEIASVAVTVGTGGNGGTTGAGSAGGTSSFAAHCSATGGGGGGTNAASSLFRIPDGAAGGSGADGDLNLGGDVGHRGIGIPADNRATGGNGGGGGAGRGVATAGQSAGTAATGLGAGGGGGARAQNQASGGGGGNGKKGFVIVEEFY